MKYDLLIIGCGEIGECLIQGLLRKKKFLFKKINRINILEKNKKRCKFLKKKYSNKITFINNNVIRETKKNFRFIFLSIKPKDLNKNIRNYQKIFNSETVVYSLLAGKKLSDINSFFPNIKNIFRVMLNTPICLNEGTIVYKNFRNKFSKTDLFLLNLLGEIYYLKDEKFFNILTAVVGSGPAFFKNRYGLETVPLLMYSPYDNWTVTNPQNSILRHAVTIWKNLPIPLTRIGGIILAKHVL